MIHFLYVFNQLKGINSKLHVHMHGCEMKNLKSLLNVRKTVINVLILNFMYMCVPKFLMDFPS